MANEYDYLIQSGANMFRDDRGGFAASGGLTIGKTTSPWDGALRFTNVQVSQGTSVVLADIKVYVQTKGAGSTSIKITTYGIDEDNTADFDASNPIGRSRTTATHNRESSLSGHPVGSYMGFAVTEEANEIFARGGWSSGNALGFVLLDNVSPDDHYIFDTYDGTNSYLVLLVTARPNFYPTTSSVTSPSSPAQNYNFGLKMSDPNHGVFEATGQQLKFTTSRPVLKAQFYGLKTFTTGVVMDVVHSLGYKGAFLVYGETDAGLTTQRRKLPALLFDGSSNEAFLFPYTGNNDLYVDAVEFDGQSSTYTTYYYVFIDDIEL